MMDIIGPLGAGIEATYEEGYKRIVEFGQGLKITLSGVNERRARAGERAMQPVIRCNNDLNATRG
jgi:hypothetical protein